MAMKTQAQQDVFFRNLNTLWPRVFVGACVLMCAVNGQAKPRMPSPLIPDFAWPLYQETFDEAYSYATTNAQVTIGKFIFDESWSGYAL